MEDGIPGSFVHTDVLQRWPNQIWRRGYLGRLYTLMSFNVDPTRYWGGDTWVVCTHSCPSALNQPDMEEGAPGSFVHTHVLQRWPNQIWRRGYLGRLYTLMSFNVDSTRYGGGDTWVVCTHSCPSTLTQPDMEEGIPGSFVHTDVLQRWPNQIWRRGYLGRLYTLMSYNVDPHQIWRTGYLGRLYTLRSFNVDPTRYGGRDTWVVCTHWCPSTLTQPDMEEGIPGSFVHTNVLQRWPNQISRRGYLGRLYTLMSFNVGPTRSRGGDTWVVCTHSCPSTLTQPDMEDGIPGSFVNTHVLQRWPTRYGGGDTWVVCTPWCPSTLTNQIWRRGYLGRLYTLMSFNVDPTRYGGRDTWVVCTHWCPSTLTQPDMEEGIPGSFVHTDVLQRWPNQIWRTGYLGRLYTLMSFNVDPTRYGGGDTWVVCTHSCPSTLTQPDMEEGIPGSFVHTHVLQRWPNQIWRRGYLGRLYTLMSFSVDQPDMEDGIPGSFVHTGVLQRWPNQIWRRGYLGPFVHTNVLQRWPNQIWRRGYQGRL